MLPINVGEYVCICVSLCVCVYVCMYVCMCVYSCMLAMYTTLSLRPLLYVSTCIRSCVHVHVHNATMLTKIEQPADVKYRTLQVFKST